MSHIEDGTVKARHKKTGEILRVKPGALKYSKNLELAPSERSKQRQASSAQAKAPQPAKAKSTPKTSRPAKAEGTTQTDDKKES